MDDKVVQNEVNGFSFKPGLNEAWAKACESSNTKLALGPVLLRATVGLVAFG